MNSPEFYICELCGNLVFSLEASGIPLKCCGKNMQKLVPGTIDADHEKHVPVIKCSENTLCVDIGAKPHPMEEKHYIQWIFLQTDHGGYFRFLAPKDKPSAVFCLNDEKAIAVYAYCNIHGLWKTII